MLKLSSLKIDPEFSAQILPLSFEELQQLEMNMIRDGKLTDPIIVWNKTILDGHNRYNILRKHSFIEYEIKEMQKSCLQSKELELLLLLDFWLKSETLDVSLLQNRFRSLQD